MHLYDLQKCQVALKLVMETLYSLCDGLRLALAANSLDFRERIKHQRKHMRVDSEAE